MLLTLLMVLLGNANAADMKPGVSAYGGVAGGQHAGRFHGGLSAGAIVQPTKHWGVDLGAREVIVGAPSVDVTLARVLARRQGRHLWFGVGMAYSHERHFSDDPSLSDIPVLTSTTRGRAGLEATWGLRGRLPPFGKRLGWQLGWAADYFNDNHGSQAYLTTDLALTIKLGKMKKN